MKSQDELLQKVRLCMTRNIPKLAIAMLAIGIVMAVTVFIFITPLAIFALANMNIVSSLALLVSTIVLYAIEYVLLYGFFILVIRLYREQHSVFGHLLTGFRDFKRACLVGLFFTSIITGVIFIIALLPSFMITTTLLSGGDVTEYQNNMFFIAGILLLVLLLSLVTLHLRYGFVWFLLYEQPDLKVRAALKQSTLLTKGNRLNFVLFCIKSAGGFLLAFVLTLTASTFLPPSMLVNTVNFLCLYATLIRICIAFAAWYTSCSDSKIVIDTARDTVIQLPDSRTSDSTDVNENSEE